MLMSALAVGVMWWLQRPLVPAAQPGQDPSKVVLELVVPKGSSATTIGFLMRDAGLAVGETSFALTARLLGQHRQLQAGVYGLTPGISLQDLIGKMARGDALQDSLTLVEGWRFSEILGALHRHPGVVKTLPIDAAQAERVLLAQLNLGTPGLEGWIFPDTYLFMRGSTDVEIVQRSVRLQQAVLAQAWEARSSHVALQSPYEALILASMIERETQVEADRAFVSAVFHQRLREGMRLESDPTVIYGLGDRFDGDLRRADLRRPMPHNTYVIRGLPPTPIASPGRAAIVAALTPAVGRWRYFVAMGDGRSYFSHSLAQHNRAVQFYQLKKGPPPPRSDQGPVALAPPDAVRR
ncbi:MAG: endolytic transglycosylase MltG [Pseudomonadota bacterium]